MAKGRLIIKEASYSKQIWVQMDEFAALIFYAAIPHLESDGTLPRDPERLKLTVCPFSSKPVEWFERTIKTWLSTNPAVVIEGKIKGNPTLYFTDFIRSQMGLSHSKPPIFDNGENNAASFSINSRDSRKATEVNRSEVNRIKKKTTYRPSALATPKETTPIQKVVGAYKIAKGIDKNDKAWDRANFSRYAKAAKTLLEAFKTKELAIGYVIFKSDEFKEKGLDFTLETIARHAHDQKGELNVSNNEGINSSSKMVSDTIPEPRSIDGVAQERKEGIDKLASGVLRALPNFGTDES